MKNIYLTLCLLTLGIQAQEHFAGINTTSRTGILNGIYNPAELANMSNKYEIQFFATSINVANNKISLSDAYQKDQDFEKLIFEGDDPVNFRFDTEILGPGFAFKYKKWAFGISTRAFAKGNLMNIDTKVGDAISNTASDILSGSETVINNKLNQRINGTSWGEVGFSIARSLIDNDRHSLNVGATYKFLFPGSYANFGLGNLNGVITVRPDGNSYLSDASGFLNATYSGNLANDFTNTEDYTKSLFGGLNGSAVDFGVNYRLKRITDKGYYFNAGMSIRNLGNMSFNNSNNSSTSYTLSIPQANALNPNSWGLNLSQFSDVSNIEQIEQILLDEGYLDRDRNNQSFDVKLPTTLALYADIRVIDVFFVSLFTQQKINEDSGNDQITTQNTFTITPRFTNKNFELFAPFTENEISNFNIGLGIRLYGFFIGSNSMVTALANDTKQLDFFLGWRMGFGKL
jgi:hypothetical protein